MLGSCRLLSATRRTRCEGTSACKSTKQVSVALAEGTDAETAALNVEMGSLAVPNSAQHAAETALASLEARRRPVGHRVPMRMHDKNMPVIKYHL